MKNLELLQIAIAICMLTTGLALVYLFKYLKELQKIREDDLLIKEFEELTSEEKGWGNNQILEKDIFPQLTKRIEEFIDYMNGILESSPTVLGDIESYPKIPGKDVLSFLLYIQAELQYFTFDDYLEDVVSWANMWTLSPTLRANFLIEKLDDFLDFQDIRNNPKKQCYIPHFRLFLREIELLL